MENVIERAIKFVPRKIKKRLFGNIDYQIQLLKIIANQTIKMLTGMDFQGQYDQDMFACLYFGCKKEGFYIDIGAHDGKSLSNTIIFENLGWKGICVEPLPDVFKILKQNRRCDCFNVAISETSDESLEFIRAKGVEMLSGLSNQMTEVHKKRIIKEKGEIEKIYVKTLTFTDLMSNYPEIRNVDFLSVDVEGAEISIIKTIDFNKYNFNLITVENSGEIKGNAQKLINFMEEQGYKIYLNLGCDMMFIPKSTDNHKVKKENSH